MSDSEPIHHLADSTRRADEPSTPKREWIFADVVIVIVVLLVAMSMTGPLTFTGGTQAMHNSLLQQTRSIGLPLFCYATDNTTQGNKYPDGQSSTEVFQKLIDGGYITDSTLFYFPMPGKKPAVPGEKLKPENVCFDVTSSVDQASPDSVPVVFMTGYKVTYAPGATAVSAIKPYPKFGWFDNHVNWFQWLLGVKVIRWSDSPGVAIFYKGNNAVFIRMNGAPTPDGTIPNFVPPEFKPDGKTYRQLTPDGVLP